MHHSYGEHPLNINSPEAPHFNRRIALEFIAAVGTNLDAVFPLVGPSLNLTTCLVCFQFHFSSDQCHLSFFLKLKTHICLKEVFYSYFMRIETTNNGKPKNLHSFLLINLGVLVPLILFFSFLLFLAVVFLFFRGGRGCGTFSLTVKIIKLQTAICTSLRFNG